MDDHFVQSSSKLLACNGATVTPYSCNFWGALLGKQMHKVFGTGSQPPPAL